MVKISAKCLCMAVYPINRLCASRLSYMKILYFILVKWTCYAPNYIRTLYMILCILVWHLEFISGIKFMSCKDLVSILDLKSF